MLEPDVSLCMPLDAPYIGCKRSHCFKTNVHAMGARPLTHGHFVIFTFQLLRHMVHATLCQQHAVS